jgi:hypothetical protein
MTTKEELKKIIKTTTNPDYKRVAEAQLQKLELQEKAAQGSDLAIALLAVKEALDTAKRSTPSGGGITQEQMDLIIENVKRKTKVTISDLDEVLKSQILDRVKQELTLYTPLGVQKKSSFIKKEILESPVFQNLLSDLKAKLK